MYSAIMNILNRCNDLVVRPRNNLDVWVGYRVGADFHSDDAKAAYDAVCRRAKAVIDSATSEYEERYLLCGGVKVIWVFCEVE